MRISGRNYIPFQFNTLHHSCRNKFKHIDGGVKSTVEHVLKSGTKQSWNDSAYLSADMTSDKPCKYIYFFPAINKHTVYQAVKCHRNKSNPLAVRKGFRFCIKLALKWIWGSLPQNNYQHRCTDDGDGGKSTDNIDNVVSSGDNTQ